MKPTTTRLLLLQSLPVIALCVFSPSAMADPPIWANARHVKATLIECGNARSILFRGDATKVRAAAPNPPGCKSVEIFYTQLNIFKTFVNSKNGEFAEANVDAGYITCGGDVPSGGQRGVIILGTSAEIERSRRLHPEPKGCTFTKENYRSISSAGGIPFTDVPNGGIMSIKESLALQAKERARAIAECDASPACQAEVSRINANNAYFQCMRPSRPDEPRRTCIRPW